MTLSHCLSIHLTFPDDKRFTSLPSPRYPGDGRQKPKTPVYNPKQILNSAHKYKDTQKKHRKLFVHSYLSTVEALQEKLRIKKYQHMSHKAKSIIGQ